MKTLVWVIWIAISGCANNIEGVSIDEGDRAQCKLEGCTVWTQRELNELSRAALIQGAKVGYEHGYKAGVSSL